MALESATDFGTKLQQTPYASWAPVHLAPVEFAQQTPYASWAPVHLASV